MINQIKHISAKTKILIFALLLIILPSAILGYLGFKSIEDRGLRLKDNYQGLARLLRDNIEDELLNFEGTFLRDITTKNWNKDVLTIKHQLSQTQDQHPSINEIFLMDTEGAVIHPKITLSVRGAMQPEQVIIQASKNELIQSGERYEFKEKNYPIAMVYYKKAMEQATSRQLRSYTRLLVGRCYFKMKNYQKAAQEFRKLLEESGDVQTPGGTPLKIVCLSQLSETYALLGQDQTQRHTLLDLYEGLISTPMGFDSYDFYLQTVKTKLEQASQMHDWGKEDLVRLDELKKEETNQMGRVRYLQLIQTDILSQLKSEPAFNSKENAQGSRLPVRYTVKDIEGKSYQIGYVPLSSPQGQTAGRILVYQIDKEFVLTKLLSDIEKKGNLGYNIQLGIFSEEESLLYPAKTPSPPRALAAESFSQFFPSWRLVLFDKMGKTVELIVRKEKRLYGAVLFGIFSIILVGIIMTLKAAMHEAKVARMKSEFVSSVSHELKTPLSLIRLFGETLELDHVKDKKQRKQFSGIIARESQRLSHLIDNVLDFSKIDSGRKEYAFEEADLVKVVSNTLEAYKFHLRDQGFEFVVSLPQSPILMQLDKDAISQALLNLLSNAEKYSKERKYIGVDVIPKDNNVWISVKDKGSGIPESSLKHLFDKFFRGEDGAALDAQGSGLGLTIVKHIVESHRGQISVESKVGQGSRFTIKLPIQEQREKH